MQVNNKSVVQRRAGCSTMTHATVKFRVMQCQLTTPKWFAFGCLQQSKRPAVSQRRLWHGLQWCADVGGSVQDACESQNSNLSVWKMRGCGTGSSVRPLPKASVILLELAAARACTDTEIHHGIGFAEPLAKVRFTPACFLWVLLAAKRQEGRVSFLKALWPSSYHAYKTVWCECAAQFSQRCRQRARWSICCKRRHVPPGHDKVALVSYACEGWQLSNAQLGAGASFHALFFDTPSVDALWPFRTRQKLSGNHCRLCVLAN